MNGIPSDACDCHMHVFDASYPLAPRAGPVPVAPVSAYRLVRSELGLTRTVVVAPSSYGQDNRCTLAALAALGSNARAVVSASPDATQEDLGVLHAAGVRGVRINLARGPGTSVETLLRVCEVIADRGWHLQLMLTPALLAIHADTLHSLPVPLVLDQMARVPQDGGLTSPAYGVLRRLIDAGNTWVKLSLASSARLLGTPLEETLHAMGRDLVAHGSRRLVWGSDWPHVLSYQDGTPQPSEAQMLGVLLEWASSDRDRQEILVDTPAALYDFPSAPS